MIRRYFRLNGGRYRLLDEVREGVSFRPLNLAAAATASGWSAVRDMDVVLCRNVLIYLTEEAVVEVTRRLVESLRPGGWLFLGPSDPVLGDRLPCEIITTSQGLAYRRLPAPASRRGVDFSRTPVVEPAATKPRGVTPAGDAENGDRIAVLPQIRKGTVPELNLNGLAPAPPEDQPRREAAPRAPRSDRSENEKALEARVRALADAGRLDQAAVAATAALETHPTSDLLHCLQADILSATGKHAEAAAAARRALYLNRDYPMAHLALGRACLGRGDAVGCARALRNAEALLARMNDEDMVAAGGGQTAGQLKKFVRLQMKLLAETQ